jgi:hypothetical protein
LFRIVALQKENQHGSQTGKQWCPAGYRQLHAADSIGQGNQINLKRADLGEHPGLDLIFGI